MLAIGTGKGGRVAATPGQRDQEAGRVTHDMRVRDHVAAVVEDDTRTEVLPGLYLDDRGQDRLDDRHLLLLKLFGSCFGPPATRSRSVRRRQCRRFRCPHTRRGRRGRTIQSRSQGGCDCASRSRRPSRRARAADRQGDVDVAARGPRVRDTPRAPAASGRRPRHGLSSGASRSSAAVEAQAAAADRSRSPPAP